MIVRFARLNFVGNRRVPCPVSGGVVVRSAPMDRTLAEMQAHELATARHDPFYRIAEVEVVEEPDAD